MADDARQLIHEANEVLCKLLNEELVWGEADRLTTRLTAWLEKPDVIPEGSFVKQGALSDEEIAKLVTMRPGPIEVHYPLDEEWNAAVEAAATVCESRGFAALATKVRGLKRVRSCIRCQHEEGYAGGYCPDGQKHAFRERLPQERS